jgi:glucose-6-phosphate isomerase, archaeal
MIDLEKISGLPVHLKEDSHLKFFAPLSESMPGVRLLKDMKKVLMDPSAESDRTEMYYMYRNVFFPEHEKLLKQKNLRYDITVIPPASIGQEFSKTVGHYHPAKKGSMIAYPEMYEVLHGRVLFLLQKMDGEYRQLLRVLSFEAKAGDKIIFPPNYGHIMVNIGKETLVTANWSADNFESLYHPVEEKCGMAYYVVKALSDGGYAYIPNPHYRNHPQVDRLSTKYEDNFNIIQPKPMYLLGVSNPEYLEFLNFPEKFAVELSSISS